jgi:hypothetical protein
MLISVMNQLVLFAICVITSSSADFSFSGSHDDGIDEYY